MTIVHDDSGITHGVYWSSTSYAAMNRALDDLRKIYEPEKEEAAA